ncbi:MAG TPA: STAS domain-containing protein [Gaiellales bacterium]|jgi:anti-anti-sigma factor|nr:STAS domain-containing protein [Gaiellales bacterium]
MTSGANGIDVERIGAVDVVTLHGEHDLSTATDVSRRIDSALETASGLAIDLSQTTFIDSAVLRVLITAQERASAQGAGFAIAVADSSGHGVHRLLTLTGLDAKLSTRPSREDAIAAAGAR